MGTSKGYGGPPNGLVPTWLAPSGQGGADIGEPDGAQADGDEGYASAPPMADTAGFTAARNAFTRFSKTGASSSLAAAMANYVRGNAGGSGGARRAAQRMGASRAAGARLLGFIRDIQQNGAAEVLRRLDLTALTNRPAADVFIAMLEFLCPPGGAIDEAISRQALLEAIENLEQAGEMTVDTLSPEMMQEFFLDFIVLSIEGRIIADIGARGLMASADIQTLEGTYVQLHEFVDGCARVHLAGLLTGIGGMNSREIERRIDEIYEAAFSLIGEAGEDGQ